MASIPPPTFPAGIDANTDEARLRRQIADQIRRELETRGLTASLPPVEERAPGYWPAQEEESWSNKLSGMLARGKEGAVRALQTIPTGPITGALSGLTGGRSQEALTRVDLSNPEAPNMAAAIEGLGLVEAPGLGSKALISEIAGNARTQTGPPSMRDQPISAAEVRNVLERWKEFAPEQAEPAPRQAEVDAIHEGMTSQAEPEPTVALYSAGNSSFWTRDPNRAASYPGLLRRVEVPQSAFEAGRADAAKSGQPSPHDTVLAPEWAAKGVEVEKPDVSFDIGDTGNSNLASVLAEIMGRKIR